MSKYNNGEHISLHFEDYENEEFFKGHLTEDECRTALFESCGYDCEVVKIKRYAYAFWGIGFDSSGDRWQALYERSEGGRGRFKVTVIESKRC